MSRDPAQQESVAVVLAAEELFVFVQLKRQADFVAGGAKLRAFVQWLEKRLLVKVRLGLHQLLVDVAEQLVGAECKRVVDRLIDRVVSIAASAVHVRNGVARSASDAGLRSGMFFEIKIRVV